MKKYHKVTRYGKKDTDNALHGTITIMEKLDGSCGGFELDDGKVKVYSRNTELNESNTLGGFYEWVSGNVNKGSLHYEYIYFGEWLRKHRVEYNERAYGQFYLFDVYNKTTGEYQSLEQVQEEADLLGINVAPVFYHGKFQSIDHIKSFVGKSALGPEGEGVVAKNTDYKDRHGHQLFVKFISDKFSEVEQKKKSRGSGSKGIVDQFLDDNLTHARVEKMLERLVDEGQLDEDYTVEDMPIILKHSARRIGDDVLEEEQDHLIKQVRKRIGKKYPVIVKEVLQEKGKL